jgi:hypothetical protein
MRWTRHGVVCVSHADERHGADGEVVWSWPPGAEAKVVGFDEFDGRQGQESRSLGRSRISRETIAQGMPDDPADPVVTAACTFFARGPWVRPSPGIPCALSVGGRTNRQDSDAKCVAGMLAFDSRHASTSLEYWIARSPASADDGGGNPSRPSLRGAKRKKQSRSQSKSPDYCAEHVIRPGVRADPLAHNDARSCVG